MPLQMRSGIGLVIMVIFGATVGWAQDAEPPAVEEARPLPPPASPGLVRHRCRLFPTGLDDTVDTWDRSTALGEWVLAQQDAGWRVDDIEMTVGRKETGFVQAWTQVCLVPRTGRQPTE